MDALRPITSRLRARLQRATPFDDAVEVVELEGSTEWDLDPIVSLPDELHRLIAHGSNSLAERNLALLSATSMRQGPCRMYRVRNAIIADGTVLTSRSYQSLQERRRRPVLRGDPEVISDGALCSTSLTERYFAHWLHDGLPHELLAAAQSLTPLVLQGVDRPHEAGYRELTGLAARRLCYAQIANLWLLEDGELGWNRAQRLEQIATCIRASVPRDGPEYVFIARSKSGVGRILANEDEVIETLEKRNFAIVRPEITSSVEIARKLVNARVVVGVEGSAMGHALVAVPKSKAGFVLVMGPRDFNMHYRPYAAARGIRLAYTIGEMADSDSFTQPVDRLLTTIDLLSAALR